MSSSVLKKSFFCYLAASLCCSGLNIPAEAQSGARPPAVRANRGRSRVNRGSSSTNRGSSTVNRGSSSVNRGSATANRGSSTANSPPWLVAEPKPQNASPFYPSVNPHERLPLALGGFCAVALRESQQWLLGAEQNQLVFDGKIYWFVSQRQRAMFATNPQRYVPALGGDCVVTLAEQGIRRRGNPKYGILHDERLFFFFSRSEQEQFRDTPGDYANVDLANDGQCLVSKIDEQKQLPGLPETTAIVNGIRYQFAGVDQLHKFLVDMRRYGVEIKGSHGITGSSHRVQGAPPALLTPANGSATKHLPAIGSGAKPTDESAVDEAVVDEANLAMGGYCAVSIHDSGVWLLGDRRFRTDFDGQTYLFAAEVEKEAFLQNPHAYIPALGGHCVVTETDNNRRVPGNIYHAATSEGRLFLFAGPEQKAAFKANPAYYIGADLIEDGNCIVTLVDEGREIAGQQQFLIWHQSKRYLFASAEKQSKFREYIQRYQDR